MPKGGSKPGERRGGRSKGTPNKKNLSIQAKFESIGCDPLEGMARIAEEAMATQDYQLAGNMYKELAQYVAPKRKAVEISGDNEAEPVQIIWSK